MQWIESRGVSVPNSDEDWMIYPFANVELDCPPGSKDPDAIVVLKPEKPDKVKTDKRPR